MGQIINYTRLTTSDRLSDRFATCQVYEPVDPEKAKAGQLFCHLEIIGPWTVNAQIGQSVINTLIREYYKLENNSELANFERAIKKVNEALSGIAQTGETDWIGKFNAVLVLINGANIHVAQTGTSHTYLYRDNKINFITENSEAEHSPHPLKTFTNLTSGTLELNDKIVVANKIFFDTIKPAELRLTATNETVASAMIEWAKILKNRSVRAANAILIELTTKEQMANLSPEEKIDTVYIDHSYGNLLNTAKKVFKKFSPAFHSSLNKLSAFKQKNPIKLPVENIIKINKTTQKSISRIKESPLFTSVNLRENDQEKSHKKPLLQSTKLPPSLKKNFTKIKNRFRRILIRMRLYVPGKQNRLLLCIALVLIILICAVAMPISSNANKAKLAASQKNEDEFNNLFNEAKQQSQATDKQKAAALWQSIIDFDLSKITDETAKKEMAEKISQAKEEYFKASDIKLLQATKQLDVDDSALLAGESNNLIVLEKNNTVSSVDLIKYEKTEKFQIENFSDQIKQIFFMEESGIYGLTAGDKLYTIESTKTAPSKENIAATGKKIKTFGSNIYLLSEDSSQINKSSYTENGFSQFSAYLKQAPESSISDFAVDGNIFSLNADKKIRKFSKGNEVESFSSLQSDVGWISITSSQGSSSIFLLGKDKFGIRVLELRKNGTTVKQSEIEISDADDLVVIPEKRTAAVKIDNKLNLFAL